MVQRGASRDPDEAGLNKQVFISWSGEVGRLLATGLASTILKHPRLTTWVSTSGIHPGADWFREIHDALMRADYGIGCLTIGSSKSPWLNYEAGALYARLNNFKLLRFNESVADRYPLARLQAIDGTSKDSMITILGDIIGRSEAEEWVELRYPAWEQILRSLNIQTIDSIDEAEQILENRLKELRSNANLKTNAVFRFVIDEYLRRADNELRDVRSSFHVPADQYPHYLISLQKDPQVQARVKAVALVGRIENFWEERVGQEIWRCTHPESQRIFVFTTPSDFEKLLFALQEYAQTYNVYAMSYDVLARQFPFYAKDFGIISCDDSKMYVEYTDIDLFKTVRFGANASDVSLHEQWIDRMFQVAIPISKDRSQTASYLVNQIFPPPPRPPQT